MTLCLITKTTLFLKIWSRPAKQMKSHSELPWRWLFLRKIKLSPKTKNFFSNVHAIGTTLSAWWMLDYCGVNPIINISDLSIYTNSNYYIKIQIYNWNLSIVFVLNIGPQPLTSSIFNVYSYIVSSLNVKLNSLKNDNVKAFETCINDE